MRQTELHLTEGDRSVVDEIRSKGLHQSREVNRAHVLSSLDRGVPEAQIMAVLRSATDLVEPLSLDEAYLDVTSNSRDEPCATTLARSLRAEIRAATGLTASAGVGASKFVAKCASDADKPDGLTEMEKSLTPASTSSRYSSGLAEPFVETAIFGTP